MSSKLVRLYIGGLPPSVDDSTVADMLSAYGQVESVALSRDPTTLDCLGFGFAKMLDEAACLRAIGALHNTFRLDPDNSELGPVQLRILRDDALVGDSAAASNKPVKLFIGGVPGSASGKMIRALFQPYGEILDMFISPEKGYAFVKFGNLSDATAAMAGVNGTSLPNAVRPLEVRMAQSTKGMEDQQTVVDHESCWTEYFAPGSGRPYYHNKVTNATTWEKPHELEAVPTPTQTSGPSGCNIFVYGLPDNWGESEFVHEFSTFGEIVSSKIIYDRNTGTHKGYGFISYVSKSAAELAVESMNGLQVEGGKKLKVQIKKGQERPY